MFEEYSLVYNEHQQKFYLYKGRERVFETPYWGQAIWRFEMLIGMD